MAHKLHWGFSLIRTDSVQIPCSVNVIVLGKWGVGPVGSPAEHTELGGIHATLKQSKTGSVTVTVVVGVAHSFKTLGRAITLGLEHRYLVYMTGIFLECAFWFV